MTVKEVIKAVRHSGVNRVFNDVTRMYEEVQDNWNTLVQYVYFTPGWGAKQVNMTMHIKK